MEYNTARPLMTIAEYGRGIQQMVQYAVELPTREERSKAAQTIVQAMAMLNPQLKDMTDYKHKLWDHLFIISDYKLDCESPYPMPEPEAVHRKPDPLDYPQKDIRWRHYGSIVQKLIAETSKIEDESTRMQISEQLANFMKVAYLTWNRDNVTDDLIRDQLKEFSKGALLLSEEVKLTSRGVELQDHSKKFGKNRSGKKRNGYNNRGK